ncbi:MAG TPA: hypothetical protein VH601_05440 [Bryobacteraceae bacterium]|jgi:hypothetical protein
MTVSPDVVRAAAAVHLRNGSEIVEFFNSTVKIHFIDWFNTSCANREAWARKRIGSTDEVKSRFHSIWDNIPVIFDSESVNLLQFLALTSILINEVGAELLPLTEICGTAARPGLAYAFDSIPGVKRSYNLGPANKRAGELFFNDQHFWQAHNQRAGASRVRSMPDVRDLWNGAMYPRHLFPTSLDPAESGFIQQADFFKFRGRGFIQITWRANYKSIVLFVQSYSGSNATILQYKAAWEGLDPDAVCTVTSTNDWDMLFQQTDLIVASRAIGLHNHACGNYLQLSSDAAALAASSQAAGSLYNMGHRINGGDAYAALFSQRVIQMLNALNYR